jgi:hypothetical protein
MKALKKIKGTTWIYIAGLVIGLIVIAVRYFFKTYTANIITAIIISFAIVVVRILIPRRQGDITS